MRSKLFPVLVSMFAMTSVAFAGTNAVPVESPEPGPILLRPAGLAPNQKTALIVFMHGWGSSPEECKAVFEPLVESWKCSVLYVRGGNKLGAFANGRKAYNWDAGEDVPRVLEAIKQVKGIDPKRIFLTGFSSGAAMCYRVAFQEPSLFAGVIPFSGALPGEFRLAGKEPVITTKVPFYLVHGKQDGAVSVASVKVAEDFLKKNGVPVKVHLFDGAHFFPDDVFDVMKEAVEWFGEQQQGKAKN